MAVIIREEKILDGKKFDDVKVYKSDRFPITSKEELEAEKLDEYLSNFFVSLNKEFKENGLIKLKGKNGVLELWYNVGQRLSFIDDPKILYPGDKKYIWSALWYHAGEIAPGDAKTRAGTSRDHFSFCYRIAKYDREFVFSAGTWRDWMDFFDSPILSNKYILEWFEKKSISIKKLGVKNWLRDVIKLIRNKYQNIDLEFLKKEEIFLELDIILDEILRERDVIKKSKLEER